jgi:hypothetical protein
MSLGGIFGGSDRLQCGQGRARRAARAGSRRCYALRKGEATKENLKERAGLIRSKLATSDFDALKNETNADYVEQFSQVVACVVLPNADILPGKTFPTLKVNGVAVSFSASLVLHRLTGRTHGRHRPSLPS